MQCTLVFPHNIYMVVQRHSCGLVRYLIALYCKFPNEYVSERILKIGQASIWWSYEANLEVYFFDSTVFTHAGSFSKSR